jgi:hypothetical protein
MLNSGQHKVVTAARSVEFRDCSTQQHHRIVGFLLVHESMVIALTKSFANCLGGHLHGIRFYGFNDDSCPVLDCQFLSKGAAVLVTPIKTAAPAVSPMNPMPA